MKGTPSMAPRPELGTHNKKDKSMQVSQMSDDSFGPSPAHSCPALPSPHPPPRLVDINVADWIDDDDSCSCCCCCCCSLCCLFPHKEGKQGGGGEVRGYLVLSRFAILSQATAKAMLMPIPIPISISASSAAVSFHNVLFLPRPPTAPSGSVGCSGCLASIDRHNKSCVIVLIKLKPCYSSSSSSFSSLRRCCT